MIRLSTARCRLALSGIALLAFVAVFVIASPHPEVAAGAGPLAPPTARDPLLAVPDVRQRPNYTLATGAGVVPTTPPIDEIQDSYAQPISSLTNPSATSADYEALLDGLQPDATTIPATVTLAESLSHAGTTSSSQWAVIGLDPPIPWNRLEHVVADVPSEARDAIRATLYLELPNGFPYRVSGPLSAPLNHNLRSALESSATTAPAAQLLPYAAPTVPESPHGLRPISVQPGSQGVIDENLQRRQEAEAYMHDVRTQSAEIAGRVDEVSIVMGFTLPIRDLQVLEPVIPALDGYTLVVADSHLDIPVGLIETPLTSAVLRQLQEHFDV